MHVLGQLTEVSADDVDNLYTCLWLPPVFWVTFLKADDVNDNSSFFVIPFTFTATFVIDFFYIIFIFSFLENLFSELDVTLRAPAQRATFFKRSSLEQSVTLFACYFICTNCHSCCHVFLCCLNYYIFLD